MINIETFIQDFRKLYLEKPQCGSWTRGSENCDYGDIITVSKDCYMCFNSGNCHDAYYCEDSKALKDSVDCAHCEECELCYECLDCDNCYNSSNCQDCTNCDSIKFSYDLRRCKNCFGCVGLRDQEYNIFNIKYTKESYEALVATLDLSNPKMIADINAKVEELKRKTPRMYIHQFDTTECTGDYVYHSKNCHYSFDTRHSEDSGYILQANLDTGTRDSWDCGPVPTNVELSYDIAYCDNLFGCQHLYWCGRLKDSEYNINCFDGENLFGCHFMKNKFHGFYILNQEVTKEYYEKTVPEIKKMLYGKGIYSLYDLLNKDLSENKVFIDSTEKVRTCAICSAGFTLTEAEMTFYRDRKIPFPIYCPDCRMDQRTHLRNERKMYKRLCDSCKQTLITTYPAESPHIVYCLDCYWKHIN